MNNTEIKILIASTVGLVLGMLWLPEILQRIGLRTNKPKTGLIMRHMNMLLKWGGLKCLAVR